MSDLKERIAKIVETAMLDAKATVRTFSDKPLTPEEYADDILAEVSRDVELN